MNISFLLFWTKSQIHENLERIYDWEENIIQDQPVFENNSVKVELDASHD